MLESLTGNKSYSLEWFEYENVNNLSQSIRIALRYTT